MKLSNLPVKAAAAAAVTSILITPVVINGESEVAAPPSTRPDWTDPSVQSDAVTSIYRDLAHIRSNATAKALPLSAAEEEVMDEADHESYIDPERDLPPLYADRWQPIQARVVEDRTPRRGAYTDADSQSFS